MGRSSVLCVGLDPFLLRMVRSAHPDIDVWVASDADSVLQQLSRLPNAIVHDATGPKADLLGSIELDQRVIAVVDPTRDARPTGAAQVLVRPVQSEQLRSAIAKAVGRPERLFDRFAILGRWWAPPQVFAAARLAFTLLIAVDVVLRQLHLVHGVQVATAVWLVVLVVHAVHRARAPWIQMPWIIVDALLAGGVAMAMGSHPSPLLLLLVLAAVEFGYLRSGWGMLGVIGVAVGTGFLASMSPPGAFIGSVMLPLTLSAGMLGAGVGESVASELASTRRGLLDVHAALRDLHRHAGAHPDRLDASGLRAEVLGWVAAALQPDRVALVGGPGEAWNHLAVRGFQPGRLASSVDMRRNLQTLTRPAATNDPLLLDLVGSGALVLVAPLRLDGLLLGGLVIAWDQACSSTKQRERLRGLELLAKDAAVALDSADLLRAIEDLSVSGERQRLARDLHDGIIQSFVHVGFELDGLANMLADVDLEAAVATMRLRHVVRDTVLDTRSVISRLRARNLEAGLRPALLAFLDERRSPNGPELSLRYDIVEDLPSELEFELFRIAQEAVANARQHARASTIEVAVQRDRDAVVLRVEDDGVGVDGAGDPGPLRGTGIEAMRDRAALVGGTFAMGRAASGGTTTTVVVPGVFVAPNVTTIDLPEPGGR